MSSRSPSLEPTLAKDLESFGVRDGVDYFHRVWLGRDAGVNVKGVCSALILVYRDVLTRK